MPQITRGVRNNNPGNIDYNPRNQWQGQLRPDPAIEKRFARFDTGRCCEESETGPMDLSFMNV